MLTKLYALRNDLNLHPEDYAAMHNTNESMLEHAKERIRRMISLERDPYVNIALTKIHNKHSGVRVMIRAMIDYLETSDNTKDILQEYFAGRPDVEEYINEGSSYHLYPQARISGRSDKDIFFYMDIPSRVVQLKRGEDYFKLTNEELKFFDSIGFDLSPLHKIKTGQKIRDWFWEE